MGTQAVAPKEKIRKKEWEAIFAYKRWSPEQREALEIFRAKGKIDPRDNPSSGVSFYSGQAAIMNGVARRENLPFRIQVRNYVMRACRFGV